MRCGGKKGWKKRPFRKRKGNKIEIGRGKGSGKQEKNQRKTTQCSKVIHSPIQFNTTQYSTILYSTIL